MASVAAARDKPKLKLVVRCLPPHLTEDLFLSTVESLGFTVKNNEKLVDFFYYEQGKVYNDRPTRDSRAYVAFTSTDQLQRFMTKFNGHTFITNKGVEQKASVEYAPFQKVPKPKKKPDPRETTIETDPDYLQFLEELKKPTQTIPSAEEQLDRRLEREREIAALSGGHMPPIISPLLEFLKTKKHGTKPKAISKRGDRAERRKRAKERDRDGKDPRKDGTKQDKGGLKGTDEKKPRRERGGKRKDRDERRKKKKDPNAPPGPPTDRKEPKLLLKKTDAKAEIDPKTGVANPGNWQARKNEPGAFAIQPRDATAQSQADAAPAAAPAHVERQNTGQNFGQQNRGGRKQSQTPRDTQNPQVPGDQNANQSQSPNPNQNRRGQGGRRGGGSAGANRGADNKQQMYAPKQQVYAPKQATPTQNG
eukprot:TRINITY_DN8373_c0_g1_i1.p1 TRINITY_DN8373_c0_g1~~TRINITY_DN8373_c0_g1_i1.p1  ORF type:complete len:421 (-),score=86.97 TRINITY_DN8373_c0_g1_i1:40-1302(-)